MKPVSRRTFLTAAPLALSGCTGVLDNDTPTPTPRPDSDDDTVPDAEDDYPNRTYWIERVNRIEESITLKPGEYKAYPLQSSEADFIAVDILVSQGDGAIDFMFMSRSDFQSKYPDGNFEYFEKGHFFDFQSVKQKGIIPTLDPAVAVIDYTEAITTPTAGEITLRVRLELASTGS